MSIKKAKMTGNFEKQHLFCSKHPKSFPLSAKWGVRIVLKKEEDVIPELMLFITRLDSLPRRKAFYRRLAVHEAVSNALCYGGPDPILTAWGTQNFMQAAIEQKNNIRWPQKSNEYAGTALIKRYASEYMIAADKKTLLLRFY